MARKEGRNKTARKPMTRGGEGEAAPAPANTTEGEIQMPLNNVMGIMKTGGMNMGIMKTGEMMMNKCKSMKMKKKGKMTKKKSLKNKKKRRMTKKYTGGEFYEIRNMYDGAIRGYAKINDNNTINNNTDKNNDETDSTDDIESDDSVYDPKDDPEFNTYASRINPRIITNKNPVVTKPSTMNRITNMFKTHRR